MNNTGVTQNITAELTSIHFYDADSSFTIARAASAENKNVTIVGYLKGGIPGEVIEAKGYWRNDDKKDEPRFYAEKFNKNLPITENGVYQYLSSGIVEGLNPKLAKAISRHFGAKIFDVFTHHSQQLTEIAGITAATADIIVKSWHKYLIICDLAEFLHKVSVSPYFAEPIYEKLGINALAKIRANPFRLVPEIKGLSFITATFIAQQLNIDPAQPKFIKQGLYTILENLAQKGHTFYPYPKLLNSSIKRLGLKPELVADTIAQCASEGGVVIKDLNKNGQQYTLNNKAVFLKRHFTFEYVLAEKLKKHVNKPLNPRFADLGLENIIKKMTIDSRIKAHLRTLLKYKCCVINERSKKNKHILLCALEKLGADAGLKVIVTVTNHKTIAGKNSNGQNLNSLHDILGYDHVSGQYARNAQNPLECDILVIAWASMLNTVIFHHIMQALPPEATLILSGDNGHLPPSGPGRAYRDLLASNLVHVTTLKDLDTEPSNLSRAVDAVGACKMPDLPDFMAFENQNQNFFFIEQNDPEKIYNIIGSLCTKRLPRSLQCGLLDIQVLCLYKKGPVGAKKLNLFLQERLNKRSSGLKHNGFIYKVNDKVAQIGDNWNKNIYGGQVGVIQKINMYKKELLISFDNQPIPYFFHELGELRPAYALPVNKTGISRYEIVILPLHCDSYLNLNQAALYTAFLSAGKILIVVGQKRAIKIALENVKIDKRYTALKELLLT